MQLFADTRKGMQRPPGQRCLAHTCTLLLVATSLHVQAHTHAPRPRVAALPPHALTHNTHPCLSHTLTTRGKHRRTPPKRPVYVHVKGYHPHVTHIINRNVRLRTAGALLGGGDQAGARTAWVGDEQGVNPSQALTHESIAALAGVLRSALACPHLCCRGFRRYTSHPRRRSSPALRRLPQPAGPSQLRVVEL